MVSLTLRNIPPQAGPQNANTHQPRPAWGGVILLPQAIVTTILGKTLRSCRRTKKSRIEYRSGICLFFILDVGLKVHTQHGKRGGHVFVLHQNMAGNIQMGGGEVPDGLDAVFNQ